MLEVGINTNKKINLFLAQILIFRENRKYKIGFCLVGTRIHGIFTLLVLGRTTPCTWTWRCSLLSATKTFTPAETTGFPHQVFSTTGPPEDSPTRTIFYRYSSILRTPGICYTRRTCSEFQIFLVYVMFLCISYSYAYVLCSCRANSSFVHCIAPSSSTCYDARSY